MKSVVAPYATAAWCVRIECVGGLTMRLTTYPYNLTMSDATVYETDSGYEQTAYTAGVNFSPSAIDLEGFAGVGGITRDQIASGVFDNARVYIFKCDWLNPVEDYEEVTTGYFGKTRLEDERYKTEGLSLSDALNQSVGLTYAVTCSNTFGDAKCGITLSLADVTGSITHVTSGGLFRDSSRSEASDWFGAGSIEFTSGSNAGLRRIEVKSYAADGWITTVAPAYYTPQVGDTYKMIPGCRRRLEDCRDKWGNVAVTNGVHALKQYPNKGGFFGFPHVPSSSSYQQVGDNR